MRFVFLLAIVISLVDCKVRDKKIASVMKYDVTPPEMLQDPNPAQSTFGENSEKFMLSTKTTPCVSQISGYGTVNDRVWREAFSRAVVQRICGKDPAIAKVWRSATEYNPNSWIAGINLTAVTQNVPRGTAITPRHVVYTKHYGFHGQVGQTLNFLTMDNRVISRKIIDVKYLSTTFDPDIAVARLDSDLPGSITPMKVLHPNAASYVALFSPLLRIDQESKALIVEGRPGGPSLITLDPTFNPPGSAYQLYYENMISGDSSSPSILLMNSADGVMPILFALVTYSGPGQGPKISALFSQIQAAIQSFGDSHQMVTAPSPAAPVAPPSCAISANRIGNGGTCALTVLGSADPVTGNPAVTPSAPSAWTKSGNSWVGNAVCATNSATTFTATLTGPGGKGRACESGAVSPTLALPSCTIAAKRKDQTDTCELTVTQTAGKSAHTVRTSPTAPSSWTPNGATWTGLAQCNKASNTRFTAVLESSDGKGLECVSNEVPKTITAPSCLLSLTRVGTSSTCNYTLTRTSPAGTVSSFTILGSKLSWDGNKAASNTITCSQISDTSLTATVVGQDGNATCSASIPKLNPPSCSLTATRQGTTASCIVSLTGGGIIETSKQPVVVPAAVGSWSSSSWTGAGNCPSNQSTTFDANIEGPGGSKASCRSNAVTSVPDQPVRSCKARVVRNGTTGSCILTLTITGPMTGNPRVTPYAPPRWTRSGDDWIGNLSCPVNRDTFYSINLSGPIGNWGCSSNRVSAIK